MQRWGLAVAVLLALLAGCFDAAPGPPQPAGQPPPGEAAEAPYSAECQNALLFQFVEYADTDPYLPPGFHPRDPQAFLGSPAAFGKAGVLLIVLDCVDPSGVRYASGSVDIFVEAPVVDGLDVATFNFYEVDRVEPPGPFSQTIARVGWPVSAGDVTANVTWGMATDSGAGTAEVRDGEGQVAFFGGSMGAPVPLGNSTVRFWHDGPQGLGYIEYEAALQPIAGPAYCFLREGTPMADFAKSTPAGDLGPAGGLGCPPGEPIMATFPHFRVNATAGVFLGAHAQ